ncbi:hypothetical protein [Agromyces sp. CCNWLW203]|uniref:hypothetical protein n=1 Tax=Agromyces sp. CCNWLW203 TaxID=3112842 RepID=UPI002F96B512
MTDYAWFAEQPDEQLERLIAAWPVAPAEDLETLAMLLEIAADQVWAFAPESLDDDNAAVARPAAAPARLVYAQMQQAQNLWNAGRVDSNGDAGLDGFSYTPRPLDKTVRGLIRPTEGVFDAG